MTTRALAYYRTSSATNVGAFKDSLPRQQDAVTEYAQAHGIEIVQEFYDPAVSGADPVDERPGFSAMLDRLAKNGVKVVLIEDPTRFARDLTVQLIGHAMLQKLGVELIPVNAPDYFTDETPTAVLVRQVLGAISQFEKTQLVAKLKKARQRKKDLTGRCEGRKPLPDSYVEAAKRHAKPVKGKKRSLRAIADLMKAEGMDVTHETVRQLLNR
ncbi:MAG: recombinase family protein [Hyphomicrobiales bacterium]|nr:recombinase family protein [Hyphomicrobiales bacterium]